MKENLVILVNENDEPLGFMEKMEAHRKAMLHRAVSVFIINSKEEWILQKERWISIIQKDYGQTPAVHPAPGESDMESATGRLVEEMGITCKLKDYSVFIYKEKLDNELTEYELDHVFIGISDNDPVINTTEVEAWKKITYAELHKDILANPDYYTYWFKQIYEEVNSHLLNGKNNDL